MKNPFVIGLCGLAGAGKTTAARFMEEEWAFERISFAGPLKAMCMAVLSLSQSHGPLKEVPDESLCGKSPRQFMQLLGTEFGRELIGPDFWVRQWRAAVEKECLIEGRGLIVADDVRFPNEPKPFAILAAGLSRSSATVRAAQADRGMSPKISLSSRTRQSSPSRLMICIAS
jgi:hypothetical protein